MNILSFKIFCFVFSYKYFYVGNKITIVSESRDIRAILEHAVTGNYIVVIAEFEDDIPNVIPWLQCVALLLAVYKETDEDEGYCGIHEETINQVGLFKDANRLVIGVTQSEAANYKTFEREISPHINEKTDGINFSSAYQKDIYYHTLRVM